MFKLNSNINQLIEKFKAKGAKFKEIDPSEVLVLGVNAARARMSFRIFNRGEDINGVPFGKYAGKKTKPSQASSDLLFKGRKKEFLVGPYSVFSEYEKKRIKAGRQVRYKDLEFTGTLRRGIVVLKDGNTVVNCVIPNDKLAKIADFQEVQIFGRKGGKAVIFALSDSERQLMKDNITEGLKQLYARVFNS